MQNRALRGISAGAALALAALSPSAFAVLPDDLRVGISVDVEAKPLDPKTVVASEVEVQTRVPTHDEIKGVISEVDAASRTLRIHGVKVIANPDVTFEDANDAPVPLSSFAVGKRAKAEGRFQDGALHATKVKHKVTKPGKENELGLTGQISSVDRAGEVFVVLGVNVMVTPQTQVEVSK